MHAGDAAEWANVFVTAMALGAAGWAAWATHQTLRIERDRDRDRVMAEVASQAALVAAWSTGEAQIGAPSKTWVATLANNSGVPVYDVSVTYSSPQQEHDEVYSIGVLPPGQLTAPYPAAWCQPFATDADGNDVRHIRVGQVNVGLMFTDATGMVWQRSHRGELLQVRGHDSMAFLRQTVWPNSARGRA